MAPEQQDTEKADLLFTPSEKSVFTPDSSENDCEGEAIFISKKRQFYTMLLLMINSLVLWITFGIRSGFLIDSFKKRGVDSQYAGLIEGSMLLGYIITFFSGFSYFLMRTFNSRTLLVGNSVAVSLLTVGTGLTFMHPNNLAVTIISIVLRVLQGSCSYLSYIFLFDAFSAQFYEYFDLAVAMNGLAGYAGMGLSVTFGCLLYEHCGYAMTFIVMGVICFVLALVMMLLNPCPTYLSMQLTLEPKEIGGGCCNGSKSGKDTKLSLLVFIPLFSSLSINLIFGYLQVTVTDFMHNELNKSYTFAGLLFALVTPGLILGSIISGYVLQRRILKACTQMMYGTVFMAVALVLIFPPAVIEYLAVYSAFPAMLLSGIGESLVTLAAISAMYDVQKTVWGEVTAENGNKIAGIWVVGYAGFYFGGSGIAGAVSGVLSFYNMSLVLMGGCGVSGAMCILINVLGKKMVVTKTEQGPDERTSLVINAI